MQKVAGIDISKDTLAVCLSAEAKIQEFEVPNEKAGFEQLFKASGTDALYLMEATGAYYLRLACFLHERGCRVAVVNPLCIKRFIQLHLGKSKTDRKDAQWLMRYGQHETVKDWQPDAPWLQQARQLEQSIELLTKQRTMFLNSLEALTLHPTCCKTALQCQQKVLKSVERNLTRLEEELQTLLETVHARELELLTSIPGIGKKTAAALILFASGFTQLDNYRQLIAMAGLCPREFSSGSSIRGKSRITKMGGGAMRSRLYMCSFAAKRFNGACKALYDRLRDKGKPVKVALIAVCNKLLKQAFAIVKSGLAYRENFAENQLVFS
ncbi:IS110 family RNA-guided transposase [Solitalea koreensis]|uniref:Transposase n=1 Tax=Solitalea koreensis TaxID=543615 RepID=A0A521D4K6_9SPHI|nr:IS110 family transposase [Solitalea koreensis]SMO66021.1 Transposase [Solitalea koreensis]